MHVGEWVKDVFGRTPFGRITAYETNPLYDYACGDAAKSYRPEKVTHFTRQFVYLRPSCFVVFDRVGTVKKDFRKRWLLHSEAKPRIDGNTLTIDAVDLRLPGASGWKRIAGRDGKYESGLLLRPEKPGQQLELKFKGVGVEIVYTVGPEYGLVEWTIDGGKMKGKFDQHADAERNQQVKILAAGLEMGEHTLRLVCPKKVMNIELVRIHQRGRLFSRALLPKRASITLVGGPGKEWWIDGQNRSPLPSDRYAGWWYSQDPGVWRVEVEPKTAARDALFLHVLQATERTNPRMVKTQYVEGTALELFGEECWRGGDHVGTKMEKRTPMVGVKITFAGKVYTVCFWKEGPTAGRVRVEDAGTGERLWDSDLVDFNKESYAWWAGKRR